jgi:oxaloacetate decarboxylase gamma subunit
LMSSLVQRFFPDAPTPVAATIKVTSGMDKSIIAAITAAVHQHRSKHK